MAASIGAEKDLVASDCEHEHQVEKAIATFHNIDEPRNVEDQIAMFPNRVYGQENLKFILMKMEGSTGYLPIVFCADCAAPKYVQYCNNFGWEYEYMPCPIDQDFYCPKFYAELTRRFCSTPDSFAIWKRLAPPVPAPVRRVHVDGCFHSDKPDFIIQRKDGLANSIYFQRCGGGFQNLMMQKLELETGKDAATTSTGKWSGTARYVCANMVPGLEWKDNKTTVERMMNFERLY